MKAQPFRARLGFALNGLRIVWAGEASFRTQVRMATAAGCLIAIGRPPPIWVALFLLATGLVLALEAEAALEHLADTLHPAWSPGIKAAKDAAAAAVLVAGMAAAGVAAACAYSAFS